MPRAMEIATPLGPDVLLFHGMHAREELSRLSDYQVHLLSHPDHGDLDLDQILGQKVTIRLALRDESARFFNGYVTRFAQAGKHGRYHRYIASVHPWTWFLTRTADCRIFQDMTVPDIVKAIFTEHGMADFKFELASPYRKWTYCVQYRETDFNFVSRLLEHEGIYYYFRHTDGHHTLVLSDSAAKLTGVAGYEVIKFFAPDQFVRPEVEYISRWDFAREVQPGLYVHTDYDLARPSVDLRTQKALPRRYSASEYEIFDYPGFYLQKSDGEQYAAVRIDEFGTQFETAQAVTNARGVAVGSLFTLDGGLRADQNREHVIIAASYDLQFSDYEAMPDEGPASYQCSFVAMSSAQQFRPRRTTPKPFVQGPQTAVVVGPAGDEIYTDEFGRVKVQFHWDREGKKDQSSSCWIRVSQPWAGKGWGSVSTPRIGQEVIVDFLEGDPDQPIITGRVYNAEQTPPFGFPAGAVTSGLKSNTHKGSGYNELSMDDTAGKEKITVHGQYDMNTTVEHDQTDEIKNNRTSHIVVNDTLNVDADRTMHIKGKLAETVDAGHELTVSAGYTETISGGATRTITGGNTIGIDGGDTVTVKGGQSTDITGGATLAIDGKHEETVKGTRTMDVTGDIGITATGKIDIHATGAGTYSSDAKLTLSVGGSTIEIAPGGITISHGGSSIKVDPAGVAAMGPKISLNG